MGSVVDCPRCHKSVVVPLQSAPQAEQLYQMLKNKQRATETTAKTAEGIKAETPVAPPVEEPPVSEPSLPESAWDDLGGNINDADLNQWIDEFWKKSSDHPQTSFSQTPFSPLPVPDAVVTNEAAVVALQKQHKLTLTLLYVSATVAFFVGIVFGIFIRGLYIQQSHPMYQSGDAVSANAIVGTLFYRNENGERQADVDAVIICLPKDRIPSPLFSCQGLRPGDAVNNDTVQLIHEMGGMYGRADANGSFTLPYREGVRYLVIMISAHQGRAGGVIKPGDYQELSRYFREPHLFSEYSLIVEEFVETGGKHSLRHTFEPVQISEPPS